MQTNLKALFAGERRAVNVPKKRPVGRPKKVRVEAEEAAIEGPLPLGDRGEEEETAIEAEAATSGQEAAGMKEAGGEELAVVAATGVKRKWTVEDFRRVGREAAHFGRLGGRPRKCEKTDRLGVGVVSRPQEGRKRQRDEFGVSAKMRLCERFDELAEAFPEVGPCHIERRLAKDCGRPLKMVRKVLAQRELWANALAAMGMSSTGLLRDEAQKPRHLRKRPQNRGDMKRRPGGGKPKTCGFLYPVVKLCVEQVKKMGHYVDSSDLGIEFLRPWLGSGWVGTGWAHLQFGSFAMLFWCADLISFVLCVSN